jgi:hypothetical protein
MPVGSSSNVPFIGAQDLMKLTGVYDSVSLLKVLFDNYGYVYLEGTGISENGAFLIHPANWPKSDIESAKKCWPAMKRAGLQFVGVNAPESINGHTPKHFDGILNGMACELKFVEPKSQKISQDKLLGHIKDHLLKANKQGAEIAVIIISKTIITESMNWKILDARIVGVIKKQYQTLQNAIILPENGKSINE